VINIGKNTAMATMATLLASPRPKITRSIGRSAILGIGYVAATRGFTNARTPLNHPINIPSTTAGTAPITKPATIRRSDTLRCSNSSPEAIRSAGDFQQLLHKIDELGIKDDTIVVFAGDNGRDTSFHAPGNRGAPGNFRGGYFSTGEGNNRTVCIARWPGKLEPGRSDGMMHVTDWFPTLMHLIDNEDGIPDDRVIDGIDQSAFIGGSQEDSNREYFHMFFDEVHVGLRWKNFKVLTHVVDTGYAPLLKLASPHIYNLTVNPDEDTPYNYELMHSWVLYDIYIPLARQLAMSLAQDSIPNGSPVDYDPNAV